MTDEKRIWTVPNILTMIRMALIPVYWVLMIGYKKNYWALAVFVTAACTDMLDGFLARKYHQITDFGKLMDPLADKDGIRPSGRSIPARPRWRPALPTASG